jgi:hypothetical protein
MKYFWVVLISIFLVIPTSAQKVKVGFDKTVDFTKYHTFSWPADAPELTLKRAAVLGYIEEGLNARGLTRVEQGGDLILSGFGGFGGEQAGAVTDVYLPTRSGTSYPTGTVWVGTPIAMGSSVITGALVVEMVDSSTGKLVWQGMVTQKVDPGNKTKAVERIGAAITKLMSQYPPKK